MLHTFSKSELNYGNTYIFATTFIFFNDCFYDFLVFILLELKYLLLLVVCTFTKEEVRRISKSNITKTIGNLRNFYDRYRKEMIIFERLLSKLAFFSNLDQVIAHFQQIFLSNLSNESLEAIDRIPFRKFWICSVVINEIPQTLAKTIRPFLIEFRKLS